MVWQSYDYLNITLDEPMAAQLSRHLDGQEAQLSAKIIHSLSQIEGFPIIKTEADKNLRLSEAAEELGNRMNTAMASPQKSSTVYKLRIAAKQISHDLWEHVEVLEGCVTELFQQIEQMGFEQWNEEAVRAITYIKDELKNRMDDLIWVIEKLNGELKSYQETSESSQKWFLWQKVSSFFSSPIDRELIPNLKKCNKYLNFQYHKFLDQYLGYMQMAEPCKQSVEKFYEYPVLSSMEVDLQEKVKELHFLLELWQKNSKSQILSKTELVRGIRSCLSFENAVSLFKDYFFLIREAIFDKSRLIKKQLGLMFIEQESKRVLINNLTNYRAELETLKKLITDYTKFHLKTDPDIKKRIAMFFKPNQGKDFQKQFNELNKLTGEIKSMDAITGHFQVSLEERSHSGNSISTEVQEEINRHLHEMSQPLASKDLMHRNAKGLVYALQSLDEISSFNPNIVDYVCFILCKAMCADWKYHALQDIPAFHELYHIHLGISKISNDRLHLNRYYRFQRILKQLELWLKNGETLKHSHEIDLDVNDLKAYLQDFLAFVQRLAPDEEGVWDYDRLERPASKTAHALFQYLYLFGSFFSQFDMNNPEHRLIRKQLLFVNQYFEAIDRRINELVKI